IVTEALARWSASLADAGQLDNLGGVQVTLTDLPGQELGRATDNTILIDPTAAGAGWFVDSSPADDREFRDTGDGELTAKPGSEAADGVDLLTAVAHEVGHMLGADHDAGGLMNERLGLGTRRIPAASTNPVWFEDSYREWDGGLDSWLTEGSDVNVLTLAPLSDAGDSDDDSEDSISEVIDLLRIV
ncbi:MAG: reprolysin-like metallopeptidase, partial [Planctomycetota bacterium]